VLLLLLLLLLLLPGSTTLLGDSCSMCKTNRGISQQRIVNSTNREESSSSKFVGENFGKERRKWTQQKLR